MADRVLMPRALDTNGDIVSGAVAYFFETGTTTPLTVYSDSDALTELGVSATADATGTFPAVYTNETLRMDMQDSVGVSLPGFPSDSWYIVPANGVGASVITFEPVEGNPATTVQTAIENLTALWVAVTTYGRTLIAAADAAAARVALGLGTAATRAAEDTLTDGSALPDGAAVKTYVDDLVAGQPLAAQYSSAETAITLSTAQTFSHGLGAVPKAFEVFIVCKTADAPYAVGEYVRLPSSYSVSGANANGDISVSATSVIVRTTGGIRLTNDAGSFIAINAANWRFVVRAWV